MKNQPLFFIMFFTFLFFTGCKKDNIIVPNTNTVNGNNTTLRKANASPQVNTATSDATTGSVVPLFPRGAEVACLALVDSHYYAGTVCKTDLAGNCPIHPCRPNDPVFAKIYPDVNNQ